MTEAPGQKNYITEEMYDGVTVSFGTCVIEEQCDRETELQKNSVTEELCDRGTL